MIAAAESAYWSKCTCFLIVPAWPPTVANFFDLVFDTALSSASSQWALPHLTRGGVPFNLVFPFFLFFFFFFFSFVCLVLF